MTQNEKAFLDMIAWSEGTSTIPGSDDGYKVLVGSTPEHPILFDSYADHPRIFNVKLNSTAAGRYQILARYWDSYKDLLGLVDFSPPYQDIYALNQLQERRARDLINAGNVIAGIIKVANIWASLPGNAYRQRKNKIEDLVAKFYEYGGSR
jgi:muramidase (phage lysozyme)